MNEKHSDSCSYTIGRSGPQLFFFHYLPYIDLLTKADSIASSAYLCLPLSSFLTFKFIHFTHDHFSAVVYQSIHLSAHTSYGPCRLTFRDVLGITKTYLHNFDPLKPHFYIVKLGLTRVYSIFLILKKT